MMQMRIMKTAGAAKADKDISLTNNLFDFGTYLLTKKTLDLLVKKEDMFISSPCMYHVKKGNKQKEGMKEKECKERDPRERKHGKHGGQAGNKPISLLRRVGGYTV